MALQARLTLPEHGGSLIKRLAAEGALDPLSNLAHSVWLARDEIDLLAETGTGVVLNPQGNLKMKCGCFRSAPCRMPALALASDATTAAARTRRTCSWR